MHYMRVDSILLIEYHQSVYGLQKFQMGSFDTIYVWVQVYIHQSNQSYMR